MQNQNAIQDRVKREQEHQELYWFTLPQEIHLVYLPTSKEIHLRTPSSIKLQSNLASCKNKTFVPYRTTPLHPAETSQIVQNPTAHLQM